MEKTLYKIKASYEVLVDLISQADAVVEYIKHIKHITGKYPDIYLAGVGKNWYICEKVEKTFLSLGLQCRSLDCTHALHGDLGMLTGNDNAKIVFFVSKSGTTEELLKLYNVITFLINNKTIKNTTLMSIYLNKNGDEFWQDSWAKISLHPARNRYQNDEPEFEFDSDNLIPSLSINTMQQVLDYIGISVFDADEELKSKYKFNHMGGHNGQALGMDKILNAYC